MSTSHVAFLQNLEGKAALCFYPLQKGQLSHWAARRTLWMVDVRQQSEVRCPDSMHGWPRALFQLVTAARPHTTVRASPWTWRRASGDSAWHTVMAVGRPPQRQARENLRQTAVGSPSRQAGGLRRKQESGRAVSCANRHSTNLQSLGPRASRKRLALRWCPRAPHR